MDEFDFLINNALIVEGMGKDPYKGTIGVNGDKVVALGDVTGDAKTVVDARGLTALPGFIDAHSHFDQTVLWYPDCENGIMQGITTFIGGQCGQSMAPVSDQGMMPVMLSDYLAELDPYKYHQNKRFYSIDQVNEWMDKVFGWKITWSTMKGFLNKVEEIGISMNYAPLVGHATIRRHVMGLDSKRASTKKEMGEMKDLIVGAMEDGCIGMSAGLDYDPDVYATTEELVDGVSALKPYNGIYCPHWRKTGLRTGVTSGRKPSEPIRGILESIEIHKETGVRLHLAHLRSGWTIIPTPPEELERANIKVTLDTIARESKNELDITWDTIPTMIRGGFTWIGPYLASLLEPWLRTLGSRENLSKWLKSKDFRAEIKDVIMSGSWSWVIYCSPNFNPKWAETIYITKSRSPGIEGKTIAEIAADREADQLETFFDIITEDHETLMYPDTSGRKARERESHNLFYIHPLGSVGLDTWAIDSKYSSPNPPYTRRGINSYSAFPLFLIKYVRDGNLFTLDEAVQRISRTAARVHNLQGRGILREGAYADIVLLDLKNLRITGTELEPRTYAQGIEYVFTNGIPAVKGGKLTGERPGKVLRRSN